MSSDTPILSGEHVPEWMHGTSTESEASPPPPPPPSTRFMPAAVFFLVLGTTTLWFLWRTRLGVTASPWQGPFLETYPTEIQPFFMLLSASLCRWCGMPLLPMSGITAACCAALACACAAGLAMQWLRRDVVPLAVLIAGLAAGGGLAANLALLEAVTGPSPAIAALPLHLAAFWAALTASQRPGRAPLLALLAGGMAGLAVTAAAGGIPVAIAALALFMPRRGAPGDAADFARMRHDLAAFGGAFLAAVLAGFLILAHGNALDTSPLGYVASAGASSIPASALAWTWKALGGAVPMPLGICCLTFLAMGLYQGRRASVPVTAVLACCLACTPSHPLLEDTPLLAPGESAPFLILVALLWSAAAAGTQFLFDKLLYRHGKAPIAPVAALVLLGALTFPFFSTLPAARDTRAESFAKEMLDACPPNTVLVTGAPLLTSLARSAQAGLGIRNDIMVIPAAALISVPARAALAKRADTPPAWLPKDFPPEAVKRWGVEMPGLALAMHQASKGETGAFEAAYRDITLWELMQSLPPERPLRFAGVPGEWLAARVQPDGILLAFPSPEAEPDWPGPDEIAHRGGGIAVDLLTSLALCALRHDDLSRAKAYLQAAQTAAPEALSTLSANVSIAAAEEDAIEALPCIAQLEAAGATNRWEEAAVTLSRAQARIEAVDNMRTFLDTPDAAISPSDVVDAFFAKLWSFDAFTEIAAGYAKLLETAPENPDLLYESAAAHAQLGQWSNTGETLAHWFQTIELSRETAETQLHADGRFALYLRRHPGNTAVQ